MPRVTTNLTKKKASKGPTRYIRGGCNKENDAFPSEIFEDSKNIQDEVYKMELSVKKDTSSEVDTSEDERTVLRNLLQINAIWDASKKPLDASPSSTTTTRSSVSDMNPEKLEAAEGLLCLSMGSSAAKIELKEWLKNFESDFDEDFQAELTPSKPRRKYLWSNKRRFYTSSNDCGTD